MYFNTIPKTKDKKHKSGQNYQISQQTVGGEPTFDLCGPTNLLYNDKDLGGNKNLPSIGQETQLRYQFWNHFVYQIICYRELMAITWYWLRGWI